MRAPGTVETTIVDTKDYRSPAGQKQDEEPRNVQVIHHAYPQGNPKTSGGLLADAAAAVATTLQSARDAVSRK